MASSIIGSLRAVLGIDTAQFDDGLAKSQGKLSSFAKAGQVAGLAAAAAITGAAVAMGAAIKSTIDRADELSKASQKFGVGVEQLSKLAYAADLSDVSLEGLGAGLKKLSASMSDVAGGATNKAAGAFDALRISVTDASGHLRSSEDVLLDVAEKFGGMEDGAGKTALAMAIFGKSGADLIPLLNAGKDGIAEMTAEADALGLTLSSQTAVAAEQFNDNLTRLQAVGQGITTQIAAGLLPGLVSLSETIVDGAKNAQFMAQASATLNAILKALSVSGVVLGAVFDATFKTVTAVAKAVSMITQGNFSGAIGVLGQKLDSFDGIGARVAKAWSATGASVTMASQKIEREAAPAIERASKKTKKALSEEEKAHKAAVDAINDHLEAIKSQAASEGLSQRQIAIMKAQADAAKALELNMIGAAHAFAAYAAKLLEAEGIQKKVIDTSVDLERSGTKASEEWGEALKEAAEDARRAIRDLPFVINDVFDALKNRDWASALDGLRSAIEGIKFAFGSMGTMADKVNVGSGIATGIGSLIGGKTGKGLMTGAAVAGLGTWAGGALASSTISAAFSGAIGGSLANLGLAVSGLLGPIGIIAGIGIALSSVLGGKPSNHAAIAQINGSNVNLAGNKRNEETSQAAATAASAVVQGQELLKSFGVSLGTLVTAIDLGERDLTHVFLSNGKELRTAVGDASAAAEAGLRAVLEGATYTSEAQKKLVTSMQAAGAGFDDIATALQNFAAAQSIPKQIADAILQLTDPQAYDKSVLAASQKDRRDGVKAALDAGYITAEMFASVSEQLTKLEGLELDQVLLKYANAVDDAATAADDLAQKQQDAADAVAAAKDDLKAAYDAEADVLRDRAQQFGDVASSLRSFDESLKSQGQGSSIAAARAAFNAVAGKGDLESLGKLQGASEALLDAGKAGAKDQVEVARIQAQVRAAVQAGARTAQSQADIALMQLERLDAQVNALLEVNTSVLTVTQAVINLQSAMAVQAAANDNALALALAAGSVNVGGMGGTEAGLATLAANSGYVGPQTAGGAQAQADEMAKLRADVRTVGAQMAINSYQTTTLLKRWEGNGLPEVREVA